MLENDNNFFVIILIVVILQTNTQIERLMSRSNHYLLAHLLTYIVDEIINLEKLIISFENNDMFYKHFCTKLDSLNNQINLQN